MTARCAAHRKAPVKIAVVGQSGAGKSSYINTIRGVSNEHPLYAPTGVTQTTLVPKEYQFPDNPLITLWDLPGAGTEEFEAKEYAQKMEFIKYDAFVILSSERFTETDQTIAGEVRKIYKPFYFARTKMDDSIRDQMGEDEHNFDAQETATKIRDDCRKYMNVTSKIFLIANLPDSTMTKEFKDIDFQIENNILKEQIVKDLPEIQKTALGKKYC
jgi:small GTP-binding protein